MKKLILLTLILSNYFCLSQYKMVDYTTLYSFRYATDTINLKYSNHEYLALLSFKNQSIFTSWASYKNDSLAKEFKKVHGSPYGLNSEELQKYMDEYGKAVTYTHSLYPYKAYKNLIEKQNSIFFRHNTGKVKLTEQNNLAWVIGEETDTIKEILVRKAITRYAGRDYIAWFAPSIPVSDGPYIFCGLPGLILKVHDTKHFYEFDLYRITSKETRTFDFEEDLKDDRVKVVNRKDFLESQKRQFTDPDFFPIVAAPLENVERKKKLIKEYSKRMDLLMEIE